MDVLTPVREAIIEQKKPQGWRYSSDSFRRWVQSPREAGGRRVFPGHCRGGTCALVFVPLKTMLDRLRPTSRPSNSWSISASWHSGTRKSPLGKPALRIVIWMVPPEMQVGCRREESSVVGYDIDPRRAFPESRVEWRFGLGLCRCFLEAWIACTI